MILCCLCILMAGVSHCPTIVTLCVAMVRCGKTLVISMIMSTAAQYKYLIVCLFKFFSLAMKRRGKTMKFLSNSGFLLIALF